jgi:LacI family transcriptional regulator
VLNALLDAAIPAVTMGTRHPDLTYPSVSIDEYGASRAMTQHLVSQGHRRIGFIIGHPDHQSSIWRLKGYRDAILEAELPPDDDLVVQGQYSYRSGMEAADRLLKLLRPPTAIFASNDDMAAATLATAHRHNIEVPRDLTVCGFDDTLLATAIWPELTTIHQPIAEMARASIKLLERMIRSQRQGLPMEHENAEFGFQLMKRQSDGPPPALVGD